MKEFKPFAVDLSTIKPSEAQLQVINPEDLSMKHDNRNGEQKAAEEHTISQLHAQRIVITQHLIAVAEQKFQTCNTAQNPDSREEMMDALFGEE